MVLGPSVGNRVTSVPLGTGAITGERLGREVGTMLGYDVRV